MFNLVLQVSYHCQNSGALNEMPSGICFSLLFLQCPSFIVKMLSTCFLSFCLCCIFLAQPLSPAFQGMALLSVPLLKSPDLRANLTPFSPTDYWESSRYQSSGPFLTALLITWTVNIISYASLSLIFNSFLHSLFIVYKELNLCWFMTYIRQVHLYGLRFELN